jgi:glycosyltransferase involved in cell wall biosynthesis
MALKKPVVATRAGGPLEIIEDGASGILVESGDSEGLADAILRLLENPSLANQMGCAGRERVDGMFPLSQAMKEITGIYGGLL